jgi:hypothetical protein
MALDLLHGLDKIEASEEAPEQGEERETERRQRDHLESPKLSKKCRRCCGL